MRIGVASIVQETNTFAAAATTLDDFRVQGLHTGQEAAARAQGSNTELAGAVAALEEAGATPLPLVRAWAMSGGPLERRALDALGELLDGQLAAAGPMDGLVLSLHGALVADAVDDADAWLLALARERLGGDVPLGVCLDLHANVTRRLVDLADFVIGYQTYPHVDQARTGARVAELVLRCLASGVRPATRLATRALLLPPETTQTTDGQMAALRRLADRTLGGAIVDISIFPVQPWLDVAELGFAVTVTADDGAEAQLMAEAQLVADDLAEIAWSMRDSFRVELWSPEEAIQAARARDRQGPLIISESADSPTSGAAGDSPAVVAALLEHGSGVRAYATLVDRAAVTACQQAGLGADVEVSVGASIDRRYHEPVRLAGRVDHLGPGIVRLEGPAFTGMEVSMGDCAVVTSEGLSVLVTERPASTFDPAAYRSVGLPPEEADIIAVRSANLFRAGFAGISDDALILDLPGASTPRLETLEFRHAPRPLYPLDRS